MTSLSKVTSMSISFDTVYSLSQSFHLSACLDINGMRYWHTSRILEIDGSQVGCTLVRLNVCLLVYRCPLCIKIVASDCVNLCDGVAVFDRTHAHLVNIPISDVRTSLGTAFGKGHGCVLFKVSVLLELV